MRLSGLATGMDTEAIIRDLMKVQRLPLMKVTQQKQLLEWKLDSYREVNQKLADFSKKASAMTMSSSFNAKKFVVSSPNDVSIKNKNSTNDFSGTIEISKLAKNSTMQSNAIAGANGQKDTATLTELGISGTNITINTTDANGVPQSVLIDKIEPTDTLKSLLDKINKTTGVNAFYDPTSGKIAMTAKNGGENEFTVTSTDTLAAGLGLADKKGSGGQDAVFSINGLDMTSSTNTVDVNGFEFTLKAANSTPIDFSSAPDTDAVFDNIVQFIDSYNKLIDDLGAQLGEQKYRDFKPLSAEEKADMSDKEIEQWEEKAKSGVLNGDPIISSMLTKMRGLMMSKIEGLGTVKDPVTLKSIGIATVGGEFAWQQNGKLEINEKILKEAINADPDEVHKMFSQMGDSLKPGAQSSNQGFAHGLNEIVRSTEAAIKLRAGGVGSTNEAFTLGRNLIDMNKQMDRFELRLKMVEDRYWSQFNAMEKAINRANQQSASLMNSLGGGA